MASSDVYINEQQRDSENSLRGNREDKVYQLTINILAAKSKKGDDIKKQVFRVLGV